MVVYMCVFCLFEYWIWIVFLDLEINDPDQDEFLCRKTTKRHNGWEKPVVFEKPEKEVCWGAPGFENTGSTDCWSMAKTASRLQLK